eukprot:6099828-Amphidinium_carterae.1
MQVWLGYWKTGRQQASCRIGEARKPGPTICSVNPGGWSRIDGTLALKHDIVAAHARNFVVERTSVKCSLLSRQARILLVLYSAKKIGGRPSGGLDLLCRQAQPLQRMEQGTHFTVNLADGRRRIACLQRLCFGNYPGYKDDSQKHTMPTMVKVRVVRGRKKTIID